MPSQLLVEAAQIEAAQIWHGAQSVFHLQQLIAHGQQSHARIKQLLLAAGQKFVPRYAQCWGIIQVNRADVKLEEIGLARDIFHQQSHARNLMRIKAHAPERRTDIKTALCPVLARYMLRLKVRKKHQPSLVIIEQPQKERPLLMEDSRRTTDLHDDYATAHIKIGTTVLAERHDHAQTNHLTTVLPRKNDLLPHK